MKHPNSHLKLLWDQVCLFNDKKSFELLFHQLNRNLINFCNNYIHHEHAAEEIVSDVFISCWTNRAELSKIENPKSYLYMSVKNRSLNYIKKYSHLQIVPIDSMDEIAIIDSTNPNLELEKKEFFLKMDKIIERLPRQTLQVFRLIKEDGMKYQEVADLLEISPRTVQTHMQRAIQKISSLLQAYSRRDDHFSKNKLFSFISLLIFSLLSL